MIRYRRPLLLFAVGLVFVADSLGQRPENAETSPTESNKLVATDALGGEDRLLTHLSTDKPIYRPGESLRVRGVLLNHANHRPAAQSQTAIVQITGPKGDKISSGSVNSENSVWGFEWPIPDGQAGGEYTIKASYPFQGQPPAERKFEIRAYRSPRLNSQIKFLRDGYGPSDDIVATLNTVRAEGGIPDGAAVTIVARVDGVEIHRGSAHIDAEGHCLARFKLPDAMQRGEGTLAMIIDDGGTVETASKTIPILLQTVDLQLYPEGGELVAGLENRVYFEAFTPARKPADLAGVVVDQKGQQVAKFRSEHEGRGRFVFAPQRESSYFLRIQEPSGIDAEYPLPKVRSQGVTLSSTRDVIQEEQPVQVRVAATDAGKIQLTLRKRELVLDTKTVTFEAGEAAQLDLDAADSDGVLIVTALSETGRPLAERLIFRQPSHQLTLSIDPDQSQYVPGGKARITVFATDAEGKPVSANVGLTVTDESVLEMIDKREQAPNLPVMVLLENDVRELADAHVYLNAEDPKAPAAVDLLLGTQGWRRFAFFQLPEFLAEDTDLARRILAMKAPAEWNKVRFERFRFGVPIREARKGAVLEDGAILENRKSESAPAELAFDNLNAVDAALPELEVAADEKAVIRDEDEEHAATGRLFLRRRFNELKDRSDFFGGDPQSELDLSVGKDFVAVRMYAHEARPQRKAGERVDFTETLFWHVGLQTDTDGKAVAEFDLNDSVTSFRVNADAFSSAGALGASSSKIESVEPFYTEPKLPLEVTSGDLVQIPVGMVNSTASTLESVRLSVSSTTWKSIQSDQTSAFPLNPHERLRKLVGLRMGEFHGHADLTFKALAGPYADQVSRQLRVTPRGFPIEKARGGILSADSTVQHEIEVPENLIRGSLSCRIAVHPTPLARMTDALQRLMQEPNGCFEQTSSSTFPLVMAQQYFMSHTDVDPQLIERSAELLDKGYNRLIGFECASHGFEWFGSDPGHDALTAYGLLEFTEMSRVRFVDENLLARTRQWLLEQRDGEGGFARKTHTLHTWVADPACANTYNTWALLEAGVPDDLSIEVDWIRHAAEATSNTYVMALAANVMLKAGDDQAANQLLDRLAGRQSDDGSMAGATTSVVGSGGEALQIETTALALLAWMNRPEYTLQTEKGMQYLADVCKAGRFGSTQSTILALRAIVKYDRLRAKPKAPGVLQLVIDGKSVGQPVEFTADSQGVLELPDATEHLGPGKHQIAIKMKAGSDMPFTFALQYNSLQPSSADECKLRLATQLSNEEIQEGEVAEINVRVSNQSADVVPNPIAIIGVPGGLEVRHDQLKELVKEGRIAAYEVLGRDVVLYWRSLQAAETVDLPVTAVAAVPGSYEGPASRAYLYYTDEHKQWSPGLHVKIAARADLP